MPDIVNPQITDAITQTNVQILGTAPGTAMGNLFQATSQALGNAAHNATAAQQNATGNLVGRVIRRRFVCGHGTGRYLASDGAEGLGAGDGGEETRGAAAVQGMRPVRRA